MQRLDKVSKPVLWRDRSQACQDLLGHEKAAESQALKNPRHTKARQSLKSYLWRDRSRACQDLLGQEKAAESPSIRIFSKAYKGSSSFKTCFMVKQKPSVPGSARPREGEQTPKHSKPVYGKTRSQTRQDLPDHAKASRIPGVGIFSKMYGKTIRRARSCSIRQRRAEFQTKNNYDNNIRK